MIEFLNSRRMTIVIVVLIAICTFIVVIEEWFTNSQIGGSALSTNQNFIFNSNIINSTKNSSNNSVIDTIQLNGSSLDVNYPASGHSRDNSLNRLATGSKRPLKAEKCWLKESFEIVKPCAQCSYEETEYLDSSYSSGKSLCLTTGYKELIECENSGQVERVCYTSWRHFLAFLSLMTLFGSISGLFIKHRQHELQCRNLSRFRKQADEESQQTLINMGYD